jgi:xanthine dehydrogenase accessory factor
MSSDSVVVTLVDFKGSVPQILGAKALVTSSGLQQGTIGGGKLEAKAILLSQDIIENPKSLTCQLVTWNLTQDVGMTCGGVVTLLFELQRASVWKLVVFGAGHVAQALIPLLMKLKCHVTCIDTRPEWLNRLVEHQSEPHNLVKIAAENPPELVKNFSEDCFFILMTQGSATDLPILAEILKTYPKAFYVGVIGSQTKAVHMKVNLREMGFTDEILNRYHCPIGLNIGDNTPLEISYSIIAQLLQERDRYFERLENK